MQQRWAGNGLPKPVKLYNRENAAAVSLMRERAQLRERKMALYKIGTVVDTTHDGPRYNDDSLLASLAHGHNHASATITQLQQMASDAVSRTSKTTSRLEGNMQMCAATLGEAPFICIAPVLAAVPAVLVTQPALATADDNCMSDMQAMFTAAPSAVLGTKRAREGNELDDNARNVRHHPMSSLTAPSFSSYTTVPAAPAPGAPATPPAYPLVVLMTRPASSSSAKSPHALLCPDLPISAGSEFETLLASYHHLVLLPSFAFALSLPLSLRSSLLPPLFISFLSAPAQRCMISAHAPTFHSSKVRDTFSFLAAHAPFPPHFRAYPFVFRPSARSSSHPVIPRVLATELGHFRDLDCEAFRMPPDNGAPSSMRQQTTTIPHQMHICRTAPHFPSVATPQPVPRAAPRASSTALPCNFSGSVH
ncbi:hypothetical protein DFH09DRAFT_1365480 [Mycena vulgaris]|nr:hypothetical protein DFH09DRAFT_1365480 [Mycena vulgaris]